MFLVLFGSLWMLSDPTPIIPLSVTCSGEEIGKSIAVEYLQHPDALEGTLVLESFIQIDDRGLVLLGSSDQLPENFWLRKKSWIRYNLGQKEVVQTIYPRKMKKTIESAESKPAKKGPFPIDLDAGDLSKLANYEAGNRSVYVLNAHEYKVNGQVVIDQTGHFVGNLFFDMNDRVEAIETKLASLEMVGYDLVFSGVNVHVVNGLGATETSNGLGNVIVGYNEDRPKGTVNSGSHNLVFGMHNNYSSYGQLVGGFFNSVSAPYATVITGVGNEVNNDHGVVVSGIDNVAGVQAVAVSGTDNFAAGTFSAILGGQANGTLFDRGCISGGHSNQTTTDTWAGVFGGQSNVASGESSSIHGGISNQATTFYTVVSGGRQNDANSSFGMVSGGWANTSQSAYSLVCGGRLNTCEAESSTISGGRENIIDPQGAWASISGGFSNACFGDYSSISGGDQRAVLDIYDWAAGGLLQND